jgi:KaiC/GvpD/RAD55 family RecA-like ATPase
VDIRSGIAPLDEQLGGLSAGRLHLITGSPGTGKSTACYQFIRTGLLVGESVALLTADRLTDLLAHTRSLGIAVSRAVRSSQLGVLRFRTDFTQHLASAASPYRAIDDLWHLIVDLKPARLVIDPLAPFLADSTASGAAIAALAQLLDGFGVTTLLTYAGDLAANYDARLNPIVQRTAMIVHLSRDERGALRMRALQNRTRATAAVSVGYEVQANNGIVTLDEARLDPAALPTRIPGLLEIVRSS